MSGLSLGTCLSNLKPVALIILELLAYNAQKLRGYLTLAMHAFRKILRIHLQRGVTYGLSLEMCTSNLKSVLLTVLNRSD